MLQAVQVQIKLKTGRVNCSTEFSQSKPRRYLPDKEDQRKKKQNRKHSLALKLKQFFSRDNTNSNKNTMAIGNGQYGSNEKQYFHAVLLQ